MKFAELRTVGDIPPILAALVLVVLAAAVCTGGSGAQTTGGVHEDEIMNLAHAYNAFGFDLYANVLGGYPSENVFISPTSIAMALAMTLGGAGGTTEEAMLRVMNLEGIDAAIRDECNRALLDSLMDTAHGIELSIANSLWLRPGFPFHPDFIERSTRTFSADAFNVLDAARINGWVSEKTREKIKNIVGDVRPDDIAYLVNAIYFKGIWTKAFDPEKTAETDFHLSDGRTVTVPMMEQSGRYRYLENEYMQAVGLPYGDESMRMYLFLPKPGLDLDAIHGRLNGESWRTWMKGFASREGTVGLPRLRLEFRTSLVDALASLGMEVAFSSERADFSRMCDLSRGNVSIGDVLHKTFVEVNEEGTEAAAATAVVMRLTAVQERPEPFTMIMDRPFLMVIRDEKSGTVLFVGSIYDPAPSD